MGSLATLDALDTLAGATVEAFRTEAGWRVGVTGADPPHSPASPRRSPCIGT